MRKPTIRFAIDGDKEVVIGIMKQTDTGAFHIIDGGIEDAMMENILVAELDGQVVGFISWIAGRRHAYIDSMAVAPEHETEGIGAWLYHGMSLLCEYTKIKHILAVTHPEQGAHVRGMLERLGYKVVGNTIALHKRIEEGGLHGKKGR